VKGDSASRSTSPCGPTRDPGSCQIVSEHSIGQIEGTVRSTTDGESTKATDKEREGRGAGNKGYGSTVAQIIFGIYLIIALVYQNLELNRD
jgi:hypothetical protein